MIKAFQLSAALLGLFLTAAPIARADVFVDSGVTPESATYSPAEWANTWGDGCDLFNGQIIETPDAQNTVLKAIGFYARLDTGTFYPSKFTPLVHEAVFNASSGDWDPVGATPLWTGSPQNLPLDIPGTSSSFGKEIRTDIPGGLTLVPGKKYIFAMYIEPQSSADPESGSYVLAAASNQPYAAGPGVYKYLPADVAYTVMTETGGDVNAIFCATGVTVAGRTSRSTVTVRRSGRRELATTTTAAKGPVVRYSVTLANANKKSKTTPATAFDNAGLLVQLPAGTAYVKASVSPKPRGPGAKYNKTLAAPVYDATAHTVLFHDVPLAGGKKRKYTVVTKVLNTAQSTLLYQAACPSCPSLATQSSVTVNSK